MTTNLFKQVIPGNNMEIICKDMSKLKLEGHPLSQEIRDYVNFIRPDILQQLRQKIVNPDKSQRSEG